MPYTAAQVSVNPSIDWLVYFYAATMTLFGMYGGVATTPAYLTDIFGAKYVGGILGSLLIVWTTSGVLDSLAITSLRQRSVNSAVEDLASTI